MHQSQISTGCFSLGVPQGMQYAIYHSGHMLLANIHRVRNCTLSAQVLPGRHMPAASCACAAVCCACACACTRQHAVAWYYLQLGNRIMAAHVHYDLQKEQKNLRHIRSLFRAPFTTTGLQDRTAVFIVGMPRSGSTLVEQMLASHPQVCDGQ